MLNTFQKKDGQIASLEEKSENLSYKISAIQVEIDRDEDLVTALDSAGWSAAVKIMESDMIRLAKLRMETPFADNEAHMLITGQYKQAERFCSTSEEAEVRLAGNMRGKAKLEESLAATHNKLNALRRAK